MFIYYLTKKKQKNKFLMSYKFIGKLKLEKERKYIYAQLKPIIACVYRPY